MVLRNLLGKQKHTKRGTSCLRAIRWAYNSAQLSKPKKLLRILSVVESLHGKGIGKSLLICHFAVTTNLVQELEGLVSMGARSNFPGYVSLVSKNPYPIIVYSVANYTPSDFLSHNPKNVWTNNWYTHFWDYEITLLKSLKSVISISQSH